MPPPQAQAVLDFWFNELTPAQWFTTDADVDAAIRDRFADLHARLARDGAGDWQDDAESWTPPITGF